MRAPAPSSPMRARTGGGGPRRWSSGGRTEGQDHTHTCGLGRGPGRGDDGQISVYILGMALVAIMLIAVMVGITSVALARTRLMDAADSLALTSANALDRGVYARRGMDDAVPLSDQTVLEAASSQLSAMQKPPGFLAWWVDSGTGAPDGHTAVVTLSARIRLPLAGAVVGERASIGLTVTSRARAGLN